MSALEPISMQAVSEKVVLARKEPQTDFYGVYPPGRAYGR